MKQDQQQVAEDSAKQDHMDDQGGSDKSLNVGELVFDAKKTRKRAQKAEEKVSVLEAQLKQIEESQLEENEKWKELADRYKSERDAEKVDAEKGRSLESALRDEALESLSEEDREFGEGMATEKLLKFAKSRSRNPEISTNENFPGPMPDVSKDPFGEMTPAERKRNWGKILTSYTQKVKS